MGYGRLFLLRSYAGMKGTAHEENPAISYLSCMWIYLLIGLRRNVKGKVVDADTREPIEGAVVVAVWHEATATISGESTRLKDVKEILTDKNGEWTMEGPTGKWEGLSLRYTHF